MFFGALLAVAAGALGQEGGGVSGVLAVGEINIAAPAEEGGRRETFSDLADDLTGRIWAAPQTSPLEIVAFDAAGQGQRWRVPGLPEGARAQRLSRLPDGSVACLWSDGRTPGQWAVTKHRGDLVRLWARFDGKLNTPRLLGCHDGSLLITERGPRVIRLIRDRTDAETLTLPDALFSHPPSPAGNESNRTFSPVCALEDDGPRVWLWSYALDGEKTWRLAPLVSLEGGEFVPHTIHGLPKDAHFSDLALAGPGKLWLPVVGQSLYRLNLSTFSATAEKPPEPEAFQYIEKMFQDRGDWFAVLSPRPTTYHRGETATPRVSGFAFIGSPQLFYDTTQPTGDLWSLHAGEWKRVLGGLDQTPRFGWQDRPVLATTLGLFVGGVSGGPWFLSVAPGGKPLRFGWEHDFPLANAQKLCGAGANQFFALNSSGNLALVEAGPAQLAPRPTRVKSYTFKFQALQDRRGHVWAFSAGHSFLEWDGMKMNERKTPTDLFKSLVIRDFVADGRNRGWLFPDDGKKTAFCDFATGEWQVFSTLQEALVAQLPGGVRLTIPNYPFLIPIFSGDGQIAYFDLSSGLSWFDGKAWKSWHLTAIAGADAQLSGSPFFDASRRLCVPLGGQIFQREEDGSWRKFAQPDEPEPSTRTPTTPADLPPDLQKRAPKSIARDRSDTWWMTTAENRLHKAVPGLSVAAFRADEANPFRNQTQVFEALTDPRGNVFLRTTEWGFYSYGYLFLAARFPPPETKIEEVAVTGDGARVRLSAAVEGMPGAPVIFRWRLDGGEWQLLTEGAEAVLSLLAPGAHRLEARAYAGDLVADPTPAEAAFQVEVDPLAQRRKLLAQLASPELDERESAARALVLLGRDVLPFLQTERHAAGETARWWIDAVIQQIEHAPPKEP